MYAVAWFSAGSWPLMCINTAAKRNEPLFITHLYKRGGIRDGPMFGRASPFVLLTDGASSGCVLHLHGALRLQKRRSLKQDLVNKWDGSSWTQLRIYLKVKKSNTACACSDSHGLAFWFTHVSSFEKGVRHHKQSLCSEKMRLPWFLRVREIQGRTFMERWVNVYKAEKSPSASPTSNKSKRLQLILHYCRVILCYFFRH